MTTETELIEIIGDLQYTMNTYCAEIVAEFEQRNPHPKSGYASCPENLVGAAKAMNAKYGPGTVTWP